MDERLATLLLMSKYFTKAPNFLKQYGLVRNHAKNKHNERDEKENNLRTTVIK